MPSEYRKRERALRVVFRFSAAERRIFRKRKMIPVSEWTEHHRTITMGSLRGRWKNRVTPYLAGIMDASFFPSVQTIIICKAPQVGGSEAVNNCIGYAIDRDPGPVLYVYPDETTAKENSSDRIQPMIKSSPRLRSYYTGMKDDEAMMRINLQHMPIYMAWARSAARLANKPIKHLVFDETDKYPDTANKRETDPILLGEKRTITFRWSRKIWKLSTPTIELGPIWQALTTEAQVVFDYWACCPDCGHLHLMTFENIKWPEGERDPEIVERGNLAWYQCPQCQSRWSDNKRDAAMRWGAWRPRPTEAVPASGLGLMEYLKKHRPTKIGFHIPSWLSHFVSLSEVAGAFLRGLRDKNKLKDFRNNHQAVPWLDYTQERKEDRILNLRDDRPRGIVPAGGLVSALTAGVDTQDKGFWFEVRAWGFGMELESWQIREGYVDSFAALIQILLKDRYLDKDGLEYFVRLAIQDAMGHRTSEVYDFCRLNRKLIFPFQGKQSLTQPFRYSKIDYYPNTQKPIPGGIMLLQADVNFYKNQLAGKLEIAPEDPGAWHLHAETNEEYARQMCAEYTDEKGLWQCPDTKANHYWDCAVLNEVAADVLGLKYWRKPKEKDQATRQPERPGPGPISPKEAEPPNKGRLPPWKMKGGGYKKPSWLNR